MNENVGKRLYGALAASWAIQQFADERDFAGYERDLMLRSAVERQLEIIGGHWGRPATRAKRWKSASRNCRAS